MIRLVLLVLVVNRLVEWLIEEGPLGEVQGVDYSSELFWICGRYGLKRERVPLGYSPRKERVGVVVNSGKNSDVTMFMHPPCDPGGWLKVSCEWDSNKLV